MTQVKPNSRTVQGLGVLNGERTRYTFTGIKGLRLDCLPNGTKLGNRMWRCRYYLGDKERDDTLGSFNEGAEDFISLAKATELAGERRRVVKIEKADPRTVGLTLDELVGKWMTNYAQPQRRSWEQDQYLYDRLVKKAAGALVVAEMRKRDLIDVRDRIAKVSTGAQADKCMRIISAVLGWAEREALIEMNVGRGIQALAPIQARDRTLSDDEVSRLWAALDGTPKCDVIRLLLLTGQRLSDVTGMATAELVDGGWEVSRERHKSKGAHFVPITAVAGDIIERRKGASPFIFPAIARGRGKAMDRPMSRHTPDHGLAAIFAGLGIENAAVHDLRRTVATNLARLGVPRDMIERIQGRNARGGGVAWIYNRHDYADEKRKALALWERRLLAIVHGQPAPAELW